MRDTIQNLLIPLGIPQRAMDNLGELLMNLENVPKTSVVEAHLDIRSLASIAKLLKEKHGFTPKSRSEVIAVALELLCKQTEWKFDYTYDALTYLKEIGLGQKSREDQVTTKVLGEQIRKELMLDFLRD